MAQLIRPVLIKSASCLFFQRSTSCLKKSAFKELSYITSNVNKGAIAINSLGICNIQTRFYAKGKDKKKDKHKGKVHVNLNQLSEVINVDSITSELKKSIELMKDEYAKNLSLRSSAGAIESLLVDVDGKEYTLQELAQISRKNPKMIVVNLSGFPQTIPNVLKSISESGMNLNPQQEGTTLYIPVPKITKEHRENLSKGAKTIYLKYRDQIKGLHLKQIKALKKKEKISEDLVKSVDEQLLSLVNDYAKMAEDIFNSKQDELLGK